MLGESQGSACFLPYVDTQFSGSCLLNSPAIFPKAKFYLAPVLTILCVYVSLCVYTWLQSMLYVFICVHTHDFSVLFVCLGVFAWLQSVLCVFVCVHLCVHVCMTSEYAVRVCVYMHSSSVCRVFVCVCVYLYDFIVCCVCLYMYVYLLCVYTWLQSMLCLCGFTWLQGLHSKENQTSLLSFRHCYLKAFPTRGLFNQMFCLWTQQRAWIWKA